MVFSAGTAPVRVAGTATSRRNQRNPTAASMPLAILRRVESDPAFEGAGERQAIGEAEELGDDVELVLRGLQQETVESIAREVGFSRAFKRWIGSSARADTDNNGVDDLLDFALGSRGAPTAASDGVGGSSRSLSNATPLLRHPSAGACCRPRPRHMAAPKCHPAQPRTGQRHGGTTDPCRARSAGSHPILRPRKGGGLTADDAGFAGSLR